VSKHSKNYFQKCENNVVYRLSLKCGAKYVGGTGRCANTRLEAHLNVMSSKKNCEVDQKYANLSTHKKTCKNCSINLSDCHILRCELNNTTARKLVEGYEIQNTVRNISTVLLTPSKGEINYMKKVRLIENLKFPPIELLAVIFTLVF
jgi:hypothetical protein